MNAIAVALLLMCCFPKETHTFLVLVFGRLRWSFFASIRKPSRKNESTTKPRLCLKDSPSNARPIVMLPQIGRRRSSVRFANSETFDTTYSMSEDESAASQPQSRNVRQQQQRSQNLTRMAVLQQREMDREISESSDCSSPFPSSAGMVRKMPVSPSSSNADTSFRKTRMRSSTKPVINTSADKEQHERHHSFTAALPSNISAISLNVRQKMHRCHGIINK